MTFEKMMERYKEEFPDFKKDAVEDREDLWQRLGGLVSEHSNSIWWIFEILLSFANRLWWLFVAIAIYTLWWILERPAALKQRCSQQLALYLWQKDRFQIEQSATNTSEATPNTLEASKSILWEKDNEPLGTWGKSEFIGSGGGACGVAKTSWLGIPCAKKVFDGVDEEVTTSMFMKEALIMAHMEKHPCIVNFICCGNGKEKGDRFIAMELMEKSLYDLIRERKGVHFSLEVALDIIW